MQAVQNSACFLAAIGFSKLRSSSVRLTVGASFNTFSNHPELRPLIFGAGLAIGSAISLTRKGKIKFINPFNAPKQPLLNKVLRCSAAIYGLIIAGHSIYNL